MANSDDLPLPPHFDPERVGEVWRVRYEARAAEAEAWARRHGIRPAASDERRVALVVVDAQNSFCTPGFELYVGGRSGTGAVDDNRRLCAFLYRNLARISRIIPTLDTHQAAQVFHAVFLVDERGEHPAPMTFVTVEDVERGVWRFNPALADHLGIRPAEGQAYLRHYTAQLERGGKYGLTIWPYHAMFGGIGHALVAAVEEAIFFHGLARATGPDFQVKGRHPLTEHYSVLGPEVTSGPDDTPLVGKNAALVADLLTYDAVIIAGQAKSHCVAWTIDDLLAEVQGRDDRLARKVYLLEDCTSPVVVPGVVDFTDAAAAAFRRFAAAGMHVVRSTAPLSTWPGLAG